MKKLYRRFLSIAITLSLCLGLLPTTAFATNINDKKEILTEVSTETESNTESIDVTDKIENSAVESEDEKSSDNTMVNTEEDDSESVTINDTEKENTDIINEKADQIASVGSSAITASANNSFSNATSISTNTMYSDNLSSSSDENYYKFTLSNTGYISISYTHEYVDSSSTYWKIYLYDSTQNELMSRSYAGDTSATSETTKVGLPAGTYYIGITSYYYYSDAQYSLKVNYTSSSAWETEFNDSFSTADIISTGTVINGSLMSSEDVDYYKFTTTRTGYVSLSYMHEYVDSGSTYWQIYLYNSNNEELMSRNYAGNASATSTTTKVGLPAGTYYVKIRHYYNDSDAPYSLKVNYTSSSAWETEFNDSFSTADVISTGTVVNGSLVSDDDVDYYKFTTTRTGYVSLSYTHEYVDSSSSYWQVSLYNSNNEELMSRNYTGNTSATSTTTKVGLPAGTYYVKIKNYFYSNADAPYSLKVNYTSSSSWETEFNDSFSSSDLISIGTAVNGSLMSSNDVDYYRFIIPSTGYYKVSFSHGNIDSGSTYWKINLFNANNKELYNYYYVGNVTSETEKQIKLSKGTYYFKVASSFYYDEINYSIKISASLVSPTISSISNTSSGVKVKWKTVSGASGYYVYKSTGSGKWVKVKDTGSNSWTDTGAKSNGTKYQYRVYAYNGKTKSTASTTKTIYRLSAPTIISVKNNSSKKITLKWNRNKKVTGYQIKYVVGTNTKTTSVTNNKTVQNAISSLKKGKIYKVYVRSYKTVSGTKYYSNWSSAKEIKVKK